jgi:hypothetical protein
MGPIWHYRRAMIAWPAIGIPTLILCSYVPWACPLLFAEMLAIGIYSMTIKCPECGKPVGRIGRGPFWNAFAPSRCGHCGHDLRKP